MPQRAPAGMEYPVPGGATILSFRGGGFLGYFSALVAKGLKERKKALGDERPLGQSFDLIGGTSVGSILAAAIASDIDPSEIAELMRKNGEEIFPKRRYLSTWPGIFSARFKPEILKRLLTDKFADRTLGGLDRALVIPAINETTGRPVVFRSYDPEQAEVRLVDAVLASAAAPLFLPLHRINGERYADGGLIANGPELVAASDLASRFRIPVIDQKVLSVGTTKPSPQSPVPPSKSDRWGAFRWIFKSQRLQRLLLDGQVALQNELLNNLGPRTVVPLDVELNDEDSKRVDMVLADAAARDVLERAAETCLSNIAPGDRGMIDGMLSRTARNVVYHSFPGSEALRPGFAS